MIYITFIHFFSFFQPIGDESKAEVVEIHSQKRGRHAINGTAFISFLLQKRRRIK
jgi:hypothetical protein